MAKTRTNAVTTSGHNASNAPAQADCPFQRLGAMGNSQANTSKCVRTPQRAQQLKQPAVHLQHPVGTLGVPLGYPVSAAA